MSDVATPEAASAVAPAAAPAAPAPTSPDAEPHWLAGRLEREREALTKKLLSDLGVTDVKEAKTGLEALKKQQDAAKSELQRAQEEAASLRPHAERVKSLEGVVKSYADAELASLSESQRAAVAALAGDDPAKTLQTIAALRPTWSAAPAAKPVAPPPATTVAPAAPPASGTPSAPTDHRAVWERLKTINPVAAAAYLDRYSAAIFPANK